VKATNQHIDPHELLVKYITGDANAAEQLQVEEWIDMNAENRRYYDHFKLIWDESQKLAYNSAVDEDKAWDRFRERIQKEYMTAKPAFNFRWLKVAAVFLLVSAVAVLVSHFLTHRNTISTAPQSYLAMPTESPSISILRSVATDQVKTDTLPDGSMITQNKNSTISYIGGATRNVELTGEAFFNVKHDPNKPFIIKVNDVLITVIGTSFNVKSNNKTTEVIVETGIVSVTRKQRTEALHPDEKLIMGETGPLFKKEPVKDKSYRNYFEKKVKLPDQKHFQRDTPKRSGQVKLDPVKHDAVRHDSIRTKPGPLK